MKILFVVPYYAPAFSYGGVVSATVNQAEMLVGAGNHVTVVTTDVFDNKSRNNIPHEIINGVEVFRFRNISNFAAKHLNFYNAFGISKWTSKNLDSFDIIHIADIFSFAMINPIVKLAISKDIPYIIQPHGLLIKEYLHHNSLLYRAKRLILDNYQTFFGNTDAVISVSEIESQDLGHFFKDKNFNIIPNGVHINYDNYNSEEIRKEIFPIYKGFIMISLGRLHHVKGFSRAIMAMIELRKIRDDFVYLIYGPSEKNYHQHLAKLISENHADEYIKLMGPVYNEDKAKVLAAGDLFFMTSLSEAQGIVVIESLNSGLPVLISKEAYLSDYAGYNCCTKVDFDDYKNTSIFINDLLNDKAKVKSMKESTRKLLVDKFDSNNSLNKLIDLYKTVISNRNR